MNNTEHMTSVLSSNNNTIICLDQAAYMFSIF